jgi:beta-alanine degradation protein BauB
VGEPLGAYGICSMFVQRSFLMKRIPTLVTGVFLGAFVTSIAFAVSHTPASTQDPVKLSPQYYKVLVDYDQVRVLEFHIKPGEKEPMHSHPAAVVYAFRDAKSKISYPDGKTEERSLTAGQTSWRNPVTHATENVGTTEAHALFVELKKICQ